MTAVGWPPAIFADQNLWLHDCNPLNFVTNKDLISLMERIADDRENAQEHMKRAMIAIPFLQKVASNFEKIFTPILLAKSAFTLGDIPFEILQESARTVTEREGMHSFEMKTLCNYLTETYLRIAAIYYPRPFTEEEGGYLRLLLKNYFIPFVQHAGIGKTLSYDQMLAERLQNITKRLSE